MHKRSYRFVFYLIASITAAACASNQKHEPNQAMRKFFDEVRRWELETNRGPLVRHVLEGQVYYLMLASCCDKHDYLFDTQGSYVCAPSGGFSGQGDGKCPRLREAMSQSKGERIPNPFYKP